jgi:hypothetical protein
MHEGGAAKKRRVRGLSALAAALCSMTVAACGGGETSEKPEAPRVPASLAREMPTDQLSLAGDLCSEENGVRGMAAECEVQRAWRELATLITAYGRNPDALVETRYASSDEGPGVEDLTVRALAETHLEGATEFTLDAVPRPCRPRIRRLERTLQGLIRRGYWAESPTLDDRL